MPKSTYISRAVVAVILALLTSILLAGFRYDSGAPAENASADAAALAAETDAAIAAIKRVSLTTEGSILAAREQYDALPEEAKALVKKLDALEKAERTLQTLKDQDAARQIKKLSDAGKHDDAIAFAEEYMAGRPLDEVQGQVVSNCLKAYVRKATALMRQGRCEESEALLLACRKTYSAVDTADVDRALASLDRVIAEPKSGSVLTNHARGEYGSVTIRAGDAPALIKIIGVGNDSNYMTVYIRGGESATVHIKDGNYRLRYATGEKWYGEAELFGTATSFYSVDTVLRFSTDRVGNDIFSQRYDLALRASPEGAAAAAAIPADQF